jgi:hypothetical protein
LVLEYSGEVVGSNGVDSRLLLYESSRRVNLQVRLADDRYKCVVVS